MQLSKDDGGKIIISSSTKNETRSVSYNTLLQNAKSVATTLLLRQQQQQSQSLRNLQGHRIAFMTDRNEHYVVAQWSIWYSGAIAVPLYPLYPIAELQYIIHDCTPSIILTDSNHLSKVEEIVSTLKSTSVSASTPVRQKTTTYIPTIQLIEEAIPNVGSSDMLNPNNYAMDVDAQILYTSGTTGKPKGVVSTHGNITTQVHDVVTAWEMNIHRDSILHFLPLHHVHGINNQLLAPLYSGGIVHMLPLPTTPKLLWENLYQATIFMAVPTIYSNMIDYYNNSMTFEQQRQAQHDASQLRVCISGSMSCPIPILQEWEQITGHRLLERYGMTELGMVLTNPLRETSNEKRHIGYVGKPFPSVHVKITPPETYDATPETQSSSLSSESSIIGELCVTGPNVFRTYWNRPSEITAKEFDTDSWFRTGDLVEYDAVKDSYRILGRISVDILKSSGYKISAIEIENILLEIPYVRECYIIGVPDEKYGQIITAIIQVNPKKSNDDNTTALQQQIQNYAQQKLAKYKVPRNYIFLSTIPKNALGKVNKKELLSSILSQEGKKTVKK